MREEQEHAAAEGSPGACKCGVVQEIKTYVVHVQKRCAAPTSLAVWASSLVRCSSLRFLDDDIVLYRVRFADGAARCKYDEAYWHRERRDPETDTAGKSP